MDEQQQHEALREVCRRGRPNNIKKIRETYQISHTRIIILKSNAEHCESAKPILAYSSIAIELNI